MNEMDVFRIEDNRTSPPTVKEYEVVDSAAREDISEIKADFLQSLIYDTASGSVATFSDGAYDLPCKSVVAQIVPKQSGSGDPSPDNVRPISGWDAVKVQRTGKNVLDLSVLLLRQNSVYTFNSDGSIVVNASDGETWNRCPGIPIKAGVYTFSRTNLKGYCSLRYEYENYAVDHLVSAGVNSQQITIAEDTVVKLKVDYSAGTSDYPITDYIQLELGSTATAYEPYTGSTYPVNLPQTVYGGTLDVVSGELVIDKAWNVYDGSSDEAWQMYAIGSARAFAMKITIEDMKKPDTANEIVVTSNELKAVAPTATWGNYESFISTQIDSSILVAGINTITTVADWGAYLASNPLQVLYKLATPLAIQLTPQEVSTLYGSNTVYADSGDVSVEYPADTKLYISRLTEPDSDMIADANIVSGKYFMVGNDLYLATTNIANGGAIVPGTNCTKVSLATALNAINS